MIIDSCRTDTTTGEDVDAEEYFGSEGDMNLPAMPEPVTKSFTTKLQPQQNKPQEKHVRPSVTTKIEPQPKEMAPSAPAAPPKAPRQVR